MEYTTISFGHIWLLILIDIKFVWTRGIKGSTQIKTVNNLVLTLVWLIVFLVDLTALFSF